VLPRFHVLAHEMLGPVAEQFGNARALQTCIAPFRSSTRIRSGKTFEQNAAGTLPAGANCFSSARFSVTSTQRALIAHQSSLFHSRRRKVSTQTATPPSFSPQGEPSRVRVASALAGFASQPPDRRRWSTFSPLGRQVGAALLAGVSQNRDQRRIHLDQLCLRGCLMLHAFLQRFE